MTWPVAQSATEQIAKLEEPPPAGSTDVKMNLAWGGDSSGRSMRALTLGSGKARVVVSALWGRDGSQSEPGSVSAGSGAPNAHRLAHK